MMSVVKKRGVGVGLTVSHVDVVEGGVRQRKADDPTEV